MKATVIALGGGGGGVRVVTSRGAMKRRMCDLGLDRHFRIVGQISKRHVLHQQGILLQIEWATLQKPELSQNVRIHGIEG